MGGDVRQHFLHTPGRQFQETLNDFLHGALTGVQTAQVWTPGEGEPASGSDLQR
jgi:hypothetical protein